MVRRQGIAVTSGPGHGRPSHNKEELPSKCTVTGGLFRSKNKYATGNP